MTDDWQPCPIDLACEHHDGSCCGEPSPEAVLIAFVRDRIAEADTEAHAALRVLGEMRETLDRHSPVIDGTQSSWTWMQGSESESTRVVRGLAAAWSTHPNYRTEWSTS